MLETKAKGVIQCELVLTKFGYDFFASEKLRTVFLITRRRGVLVGRKPESQRHALTDLAHMHKCFSEVREAGKRGKHEVGNDKTTF